MITVLLNPFELYAEKKLLSFGVVFTILGSIIAWFFNARFDGMMDMHFVEDVFWAAPFIDNSINVALLSLTLFALGKFINKKTRFIDLLVAAIVARIPLYFLPFANVNNFMLEKMQAMVNAKMQVDPNALSVENMVILFAFAMVTLAFLVWHFILLWNGFKVATNAKGIKHILLFIIALLICETITKFLTLAITW